MADEKHHVPSERAKMVSVVLDNEMVRTYTAGRLGVGELRYRVLTMSDKKLKKTWRVLEITGKFDERDLP